jgi:hypothetical protein
MLKIYIYCTPPPSPTHPTPPRPAFCIGKMEILRVYTLLALPPPLTPLSARTLWMPPKLMKILSKVYILIIILTIYIFHHKNNYEAGNKLVTNSSLSFQTEGMKFAPLKKIQFLVTYII